MFYDAYRSAVLPLLEDGVTPSVDGQKIAAERSRTAAPRRVSLSASLFARRCATLFVSRTLTRGPGNNQMAADEAQTRDERVASLASAAREVVELFGGDAATRDDELPSVLSKICRGADRELRSSRAQLNRLYEADIIGIMVMDTHGAVKEANDALLSLIGYSRTEHEAGAVPWAQITPPQWQATDAAAIDLLMTKHMASTWEKEYVHKDGRRVPIVIRAALIEGSMTDAICFVLDNTARTRAEVELARLNAELETRVQERTASLHASQAATGGATRALAHSERELRALAARLEGVREQERTALAREIHDVLGQDLTGLKLDVAWTLRRLATPNDAAIEAAKERLLSLCDRIDESIAIVRRIATGLRPGVLDDLGLGAALEWQSQEFESRTGISSEMEIFDPDDRIDMDRATAMFRIYQELLTNVARHAQARHVRSRLAIENDVLVLEVRDDGRGIREAEANDSGSLGLIGIRERVLAFAGELRIHGTPDTGTRAIVRLPLCGDVP